MIRIYSLSAACLLATGVAVAAEPPPEEIRQLVQLLQSEDEDDRLRGVEGLARLSATADADLVVPALLDLASETTRPDAPASVMLRVASSRVPKAVEAYGARAVPAFRAALKSPKRREVAVRTLPHLGEAVEALVPDLVELVQTGGLDAVRGGRLLKRHGRTAAPALAALLRDKDEAVVDRATLALYEFAEEAVPALADLMFAGDPAARRRAGSILLNQTDRNRSVIGADMAEAVVAGMTRLAGDPDVEARRTAIIMLCRLGQAGAPPVLQALRDGDVRLRLTACDAIARRGSDVPATVHVPLTERLNDADPLVRVEAAEALLALQPESPCIVPVLLAGLWHERGDVRYRALVAVYRMGEEGRFAGVALPHLRWFDPDRRVRRLAARMIRRMEEEGRQ